MIGALLAVAVSLPGGQDQLDVNFTGRAYFESAYISSSGRLSYTQPVAEQWGILSVSHKDYGTLATDFWIGSALNNQTDDVHRRAFYCYEGTLTYGNKLNFTDDIALKAWGGIIWDWLGGYKTDVGTQIGWITDWRLQNSIITPYMNWLGFFEESTWIRARIGVNHTFKPWETVTFTPFIEAVWGDSARYYSNYGSEIDGTFLGGALMCSLLGAVVEWNFCEHFYLWGRYRQYVLIDSDARSLVKESSAPTARRDMSVFGLGIGCRF